MHDKCQAIVYTLHCTVVQAFYSIVSFWVKWPVTWHSLHTRAVLTNQFIICSFISANTEKSVTSRPLRTFLSNHVLAHAHCRHTTSGNKSAVITYSREVCHQRTTVEDVPEVNESVWSTRHQGSRVFAVHSCRQEDKFVYRLVTVN